MAQSRRLESVAAITGGAATAISGLLVQAVVQPASTVPTTRWSYPWSADAFVTVSVVYAVFHLLVLVGVLGFARSRLAGTSRTARTGTALAVAGTATLFVAELASIPIRHQYVDDTGATIVGVVFGLGTLLSGIGFLLAGIATLRSGGWDGWRRYVPLVTGVWATALVGIATTTALAAGVGVYGLCLLALGVALHPVTTASPAMIRTTTS